MAMNVKFLQGSSTNFNKITTKEANTFYYVTDKKALYLGANLIGDGVSTEAFEALARRVKTLEDWKTLLATETSKTSASTTSIPDLIAVTVKTKDGAVSGVSINDAALRSLISSYVTNVTFNAYKQEQDSRDDGQDSKIAALEETVEGIVNVGGEANLVDDVQINGATIVAGKVANIAADGTYNANTNKIATVSTVTNAIANLDATKDNGNNDLVKVTVVETDGKLTSVTVDDSKLDTALAGKAAKAYEGKVDTLIDKDTGKSVRTIAAEEIAAQLIAEDAKEALDTLEEIAAWIQNHPDDAAAMSAAIDALKAEIGGTYVAGSGFTNSRIDSLEANLNELSDTVSDITISAVEVTNLSNDNKLQVKVSTSDGTEKTGSVVVAYATKASEAEEAAYASQAGSATNADSADNAAEAAHATNADYAEEAGHAGSADEAENAAYAENAHLADLASEASDAQKLGGKDPSYYEVSGTAATLIGSQQTGDSEATGVYAAIQGATTNTVRECVDAINKMNNIVDENGQVVAQTIGTVENIVNQLTWGTF